MGNEGFIASVNKDGLLDWGVFFTFSNPIDRVDVQHNILVCSSDNKIMQIEINPNNLTDIQIK